MQHIIRKFLLILLVLAAVGCCLLPVSVRAQGSPRELREIANLKLARGEFMGAIPDLQQLIDMLGASTEPRIINSLEMVYYQVGIAHFFIGQFSEAENAFDVYSKKYRHGAKRMEAALYIADSQRFRNNIPSALATYKSILKKYNYPTDLKADIYSSIARCHLAKDEWGKAIEPLLQVYRVAPDYFRRSWAATLLVTAYLKKLDMDNVYQLVPYILKPDSFAARSVAFNLAALEAGEELFAHERYREAMWIFRLVFPHGTVIKKGEEYLGVLNKRADWQRGRPSSPRLLMRLQESIGEIEEEVAAMYKVDNYDLELDYRIARGYMELLRYWEARELFLHLHEVSEEPQAEESLSLAFRCSMNILPWTRSYEIGRDYMSKYQSGEYFDYITLVMGQMYAREKNWTKVIAHLTKTLLIRPKHDSAYQCMFLIGYASFMEGEFEDAILWLRRIRTEFPECEIIGEVTYWTAMALMFDANYKDAAPDFDLVLDQFGSSVFVEDASFRRAVCDYGMALYADSDERLEAFVKNYPKSKLVSEAIMMRGDIAGAVGRPEDAVKYYQQAMKDKEINIEFYNHCAFHAGQILTDDNKLDDVIAHYKVYIDQKREGSNIPQAAYWVGVSLWNKGEKLGALHYYRRIVEKFGDDAGAVGVDMILDEWVGRIKRSTPEDAKSAWSELKVSLDNAVAGKNKTLSLRLKRVMLYGDENTSITDRQRIENEFLDIANIPYASPAVLQKMLDLAVEKKRSKSAARIAQHMLDIFTETDYALDARMVLAEMAIQEARATKNVNEASELYAEAIMHLGVVREVFASSGEAGKALLLLGQLYTEQGKYKEADECYKSVLGVKGWRNFWPEALYGRGESSYGNRRYEIASAYYERIYLMYSHYREWAAKAYIRRAECLHKLYQDVKAIEVLQEMKHDPNMQELPEIKKADELLIQLGGEK